MARSAAFERKLRNRYARSRAFHRAIAEKVEPLQRTIRELVVLVRQLPKDRSDVRKAILAYRRHAKKLAVELKRNARAIVQALEEENVFNAQIVDVKKRLKELRAEVSRIKKTKLVKE